MTKKKQIVLAVDWRLTEHKFWLRSELEQIGFDVVMIGIPHYNMRNRRIRWRKLILWIQYLVLGWRSAWAARRLGGVIVAWNPIPGIFATIISKIFRDRRPSVVALNLIAFEKGHLHDLVRRCVYRWAFASNRILVTANSSWLCKHYMETFGINSTNISVLHDPWAADSVVSAPTFVDEGYVFSGGETARDWDTLLAVAYLCPDIPFKVIARKMSWHPVRSVPSNVELCFDTDSDEFYSAARQSRMVLLPLNSYVTAGLIVLKKSILLGRPVMVTRTPAVVPYFPTQCQDFLVPIRDAEKIASTLRLYWTNHKDRVGKARALQDHVLKNFSPQKYAEQVAKLVGETCILRV